MTKSAAATLTVPEYAKAYNLPKTTAYRRMHARKVWGLARKEYRNGRRVWVVLLSVQEVRALRSALVDRDRLAGSLVKELGQKDGMRADLSRPRAIREAARASLVAIGSGDLIIALDAARIRPGKIELDRINRMIAA